MPLLFVVADFTFFNLSDDVGLASIYFREVFFGNHKFPFLCDHQASACTPEDLPRRVSMKEMSFGNISGNVY